MEYIHKAKAEQNRAKLLAYEIINVVIKLKLIATRTVLLVKDVLNELLPSEKQFWVLKLLLLQSRPANNCLIYIKTLEYNISSAFKRQYSIRTI